MRSLALALLAVAAGTADAQPTNWAIPTGGATVSLSADRPFFDGDDTLDPLTSAWTFETAQPILPGVRFVGEIPFTIVALDGGGVLTSNEETGAALGNVQLGVEADFPLSPVTLGGYVRLPTLTRTDDAAGDDAPFVGVAAEYERVGAYVEDAVTVAALVQGEYRPLALPTLGVRARLVPQVIVATEDRVFGDAAEVYLGYALQAFVSSGVVRLGAGVSGISILTEDPDERHEVSAGVVADAGLGSAFRVGATVRKPVLGDIEDAVDAIVGLRLTYGVD